MNFLPLSCFILWFLFFHQDVSAIMNNLANSKRSNYLKQSATWASVGFLSREGPIGDFQG